MSQENVELVRQLFDAEARREGSAVAAVYDLDVVMTFNNSAFADFYPRSCHGLAEVQTAFRDFYAAFNNVKASVHEVIDAGEHVISVFTYEGEGRASGAKTELSHMAGLWTFRGGTIIRVDWLRSRALALEAVGLSE
jgi:ketosteroid isomerase-like protein